MFKHTTHVKRRRLCGRPAAGERSKHGAVSGMKSAHMMMIEP